MHGRSNHDTENYLVISIVRGALSNIPFDTTSVNHSAGKSILQRLLGRDDSDIFATTHPNPDRNMTESLNERMKAGGGGEGG